MNKSKKDANKLYETFPITRGYKKDKKTNIPHPTEESVIGAKKFVEVNQK